LKRENGPRNEYKEAMQIRYMVGKQPSTGDRAGPEQSLPQGLRRTSPAHISVSNSSLHSPKAIHIFLNKLIFA
jgi:hypothetical protein